MDDLYNNLSPARRSLAVSEALSRELNYSLFYLLFFIFPLFEITSMIPHLHDKGYTPELRYQWNPDRNEFDLYALIHDLPP